MKPTLTLLSVLLLAPLAVLHAADPVPLWGERVPLLKTADLPSLKDVRFSVIKPYEFDMDGHRLVDATGFDGVILFHVFVSNPACS